MAVLIAGLLLMKLICPEMRLTRLIGAALRGVARLAFAAFLLLLLLSILLVRIIL